MEHDEALERMQEIQRIMERTTLYTMLPGTPAIIGGVLALIGCAVSYGMISSLDFAAVLGLPTQQQIVFCVVWTAIGLIAIGQDLLLTANAAKKQGVSLFSRPGKLSVLSLTPSAFVAAVLTLKILTDPQVDATQVRFIAPVWMMCYGTGVYAAGLFSLRLPRVLGVAFIVAGAIGLLALSQFGVVLVAVSFGAFHIVFGILVIGKSRESSAT